MLRRPAQGRPTVAQGVAAITATLEQSALHVVQLTDAHLGKHPGDCLLGLDTDDSLHQVLATLAADPLPRDLLLATGDLSNDGSVSALRRFQQLTAGLAGQSLWLPGNHDELASMQAVASADAELRRSLLIGGWLIVMLNSQVPRAVGGALSADELAWLAAQLQAHPSTPTMLCMHHHLLPVGCDWLDQQRIDNAEAVLQLLAGHPQVRLISNGHVHQQCQQHWRHIQLFSTPSTCIQFAPDSAGFKLDRALPGYRRFALYPDGRFSTEVVRVADMAMTLDFSLTEGY